MASSSHSKRPSLPSYSSPPASKARLPSPSSLTSPLFPTASDRLRRRTSLWAPFLRSPRVCFILGLLVSQSLVLLLPRSLNLNLNLPRPSWAVRETMTGVRPRFVLFGDSLTQHSFGEGGWGAAFQDRYARKADVVLRGYSGYNSRWALHLLPKIFPERDSKPPHEGPLTLVTVFFGANDAVLPDRSSKKQFVPLEEYEANLVAIAKAVEKHAPDAKIVFITPPPIDEEGRLRYARETYLENAITVPERTNDNTGKYAAACKAAAAAVGATVVDLWTKLQERPNWQLLLSDGLHFTQAGNGAVFEEVYSVIENAFPLLTWSRMPWDFPEHTAIDGVHPALAFRGN